MYKSSALAPFNQSVKTSRSSPVSSAHVFSTSSMMIWPWGMAIHRDRIQRASRPIAAAAPITMPVELAPPLDVVE